MLDKSSQPLVAPSAPPSTLWGSHVSQPSAPLNSAPNPFASYQASLYQSLMPPETPKLPQPASLTPDPYVPPPSRIPAPKPAFTNPRRAF
jgi:hypothetical protein